MLSSIWSDELSEGEALFICNPNRPLWGACRIMQSIIIHFLVWMSNKEYQFGGYLFCTVNLKKKKLWFMDCETYFFTARYISKHTNNPPTENQFEIHYDYLICIPSFTWVLKIARKRCETFFSSTAFGDFFRGTFKLNDCIKCYICMLCYVY